MLGREEDGEGKELFIRQSHHIIYQRQWMKCYGMGIAEMAENGTGSGMFVVKATQELLKPKKMNILQLPSL